MNKGIEAMLSSLINKRKIGGSHTPEEKLVNSKKKWLNEDEKKDFDREYKELKKEGIFLRGKKRTGKSYAWHISLRPKKVCQVKEMLK